VDFKFLQPSRPARTGTSNPKPHWNHTFASILSILKFARSCCPCDELRNRNANSNILSLKFFHFKQPDALSAIYFKLKINLKVQVARRADGALQKSG
jgi:hypothetical protein